MREADEQHGVGRPDPEAMLALARDEEGGGAAARRGKLKVFFGAAPGVGKTYAMLEEARKRAAEGVDVLVAYAEPHGRSETEAQLLGMDLLPYKVVEYRGAQLRELDLDAALARHPQLACVDELAHTNGPGLRHQKRWQDVTELLGAGIDVYTTLNVQHLESVNDVVERITGVSVRETLPDSVLDGADEVEMVDTSPDELLERLREGRVYRADVAARAARGFFNKGNLIALRELALRKTAERVDAQMRDFRRDHAVRTTWEASERILVCVGPSPLSQRLVRSARRLATGLRATWVAAYVETPGAADGLPAADHDRVTQTLALAQKLGAETVTLSGERVADELVSYATSHHVTKIVIGKPERPRWRELWQGSVVSDLVRSSGQIDVYVIRGEHGEAGGGGAADPRPNRRPVPWGRYAMAVGAVAATTALCTLIHRRFELANLVMIYLLGVVAVATRFGRGPAILASVLSVAAFDFFFVPPRFTLAVTDTQYLVTFAVMLVVALVISTLTHRVRRQAEAARGREQRTAALLALSRELAASRDLGGVADAAARQVAALFESQVVVLTPGPDGNLAPRGARVSDFAVDEKEGGVARWAYDHQQAAGQGTATLPAAGALYVPLAVSGRTVGVMGVVPRTRKWLRDPEQMRLLEAFASQSASAIERAKLAEEATAAWERVEAEFLRNTLLSSVSHDLRTPLAAIQGAASSLVEADGVLDGAARRELAESIAGESERMDRLINNLLDMTRLESGGLQLTREWQPVQEVVGSALNHLEKRLRGRAVGVDVPAGLPLVRIDAISIEQVLVNLLDNALQYTPAGSPLELNARAAGGMVTVEALDRGPGLPAGAEARVFQKFFRAHGGPVDGRRRGIGLGLAICQGIVEAHGGRIWAENREGGGAAFRFTIPVEQGAPKVDVSE